MLIGATAVKTCTYCGRADDEAQATCRECGTPLPVTEDSPVTNLQSPRPRIKVGAAYVLAVLILVFVLTYSRTGSQRFDGLQIEGSAKFQAQVVSALVLLRDKSPSAYLIVTTYVGVIKQARRSGMRSELVPPTFELANPTAFYSVTWCAGSIAHDSFHSKLFDEYRKTHARAILPEVWELQVEEEKQCLAHQVQVLREIGAPLPEITHCAEQDGTHADVNKDGKYDWDDYRKGDW